MLKSGGGGAQLIKKVKVEGLEDAEQRLEKQGENSKTERRARANLCQEAPTNTQADFKKSLENGSKRLDCFGM